MSVPPTDPTGLKPVYDSLLESSLSGTTGAHSGDGSEQDGDPPPEFHPPTHPGDLGRLGRYRVLKPLGKGGMGAVYLGFDEVLKRKVALKVLSRKFATLPVARERFLREARTAAAVSSPHIIAIIDVAEDVGIPFIAMEYLQGIPLDRYLATHPTLSIPQVLRIGQEVSRGLAAAHAAGLIHRDIKPANLWLEAPHGRVKILDFGLAKETAPTEDAGVTHTGQVIGTPAFMSPEQARGEKADARADLFCLGIVLYRLCTGRQPFEGPTAVSVLMSIGMDEPRPIRELNPHVPEALAALVMRLLRKKPADRPQTAMEVHAALIDLEEASAVPEATAVEPEAEYVPIAVPEQGDQAWARLDESTETTGRLPLPESHRKPTRRNGVPWLTVVGAVSVLLASGLLLAVLNKRPRAESEPVAHAEPPAPQPVAPQKGDPDRKAAEWVLSLPGSHSLELVVGGTVTHLSRLPPQRFKLRRVLISEDYPVTDADLDWFQDLTGLEGINCRRTLITDAGMERMSKFPAAGNLTELRLGTEELTDAAIPHYAQFRSLRLVRLTGPHLTADGVKALHAHCPDVSLLHLDGVQLVNGSLSPFGVLRRFRKLDHLGVSCPPVTAWGLGYLATWPGLKSLRLSGQGVTDAELDPLLRVPGLPALELDGTGVTDAGLLKLAKSTTLRRLTIGDSLRVTMAGVLKLKAALPDCAILFDGYNPRQDPDRLAAEWALSKPSGGVKLHGVPGVVWSAERLPAGPLRVTGIDLASAAHLLTDDDLEHLLPLTGVTSFRSGRGRITDAGLKRWSESPSAPNYTSLVITSPELTDAGLGSLKGFRSLTHIEFAWVRVNRRTLAHLQDLPHLTEVVLRGTNTHDDALKSLAAIPTLTSIDLGRTPVTDDGLMTLAAVKGLKSLNVRETRVTPSGLKKFSAAVPGCRVSSDFVTSASPPLSADWVASVARMTPEERAKAVGVELVRRNPRFDGNLNPKVTAAGVEEVGITSDAVSDITPLKVLTGLIKLRVSGDERGTLFDLSPLSGLRLREVHLEKQRGLSDLAALKGMPLSVVSLAHTGVADLTPLAGAPLRSLTVPGSIKDFSPLLKCPDLTHLDLDLGLVGLAFSPTLIDPLRSHPGLKTVENIPVSAFWPGWDARKEPSKLAGPQKAIATNTRDARWVAWDAEGKLLATTGFEGKVQVWDARSGERLRLFEVKGLGNCVAFVPKTDLLAASFLDGLRLWNVKTGRQDGERIPSPGQFWGLAVSPDGGTLVANPDGRRGVARYSTARRQPLPPLDGHNGGVLMSAFSHSGKHLATAAAWPDSSVRVWELAGPREVYRQDRLSFDSSAGVAFSPDDRLLLVGNGRGVLELIDWKDRKTERAFHWFPITSLTFGPGGRHLILGGQTGILTVLDVATGGLVAEANGVAKVSHIAVSPDGKTVATSHADGNVRMWDWAKLIGEEP